MNLKEFLLESALSQLVKGSDKFLPVLRVVLYDVPVHLKTRKDPEMVGVFHDIKINTILLKKTTPTSEHYFARIDVDDIRSITVNVPAFIKRLLLLVQQPVLHAFILERLTTLEAVLRFLMVNRNADVQKIMKYLTGESK